MIPVIIKFGPIPINSFGLMLVLALLASWRIFTIMLAKTGEPVGFAERAIFWAGIGGVVGGRITFLISFPQEFLQNPLGALFSSAGFVFYGGLIGGFLAVTYLLARNGLPFAKYADLAAPAMAIGYAVGRIGCQLAGDGDYGIPSNLPWAMGYPLGVVPTPPGLRVHPAPAYESLIAFALTWLLFELWQRKFFKKEGQLFGLYLVLTAVPRFLVEYIRIEPQVLYTLTQAQITSIVLFVLGVPILIFGLPKRKRSSGRLPADAAS